MAVRVFFSVASYVGIRNSMWFMLVSLWHISAVHVCGYEEEFPSLCVRVAMVTDKYRYVAPCLLHKSHYSLTHPLRAHYQTKKIWEPYPISVWVYGMVRLTLPWDNVIIFGMAGVLWLFLGLLLYRRLFRIHLIKIRSEYDLFGISPEVLKTSQDTRLVWPRLRLR